MSDSKHLDRIESKLDTLDKRLDKMDVHMAVYNEQLKIHIAGVNDARTDIRRIDRDIEPIKSHVARMEGALKLVGIIAMVVSIGAGIAKILSLFLNH